MEKEKILDKTYRIIKLINSGLSGEIYKVEEMKTNKIYIAKIFKEGQEEFYQNEKDALNKLKNEGVKDIVNIINWGEGFLKDGDSKEFKKYIILDFYEKGDLCKFINLAKGLKLSHAKLIFKKIAEAVESIHKKGIYHRDLKTANILFDEKLNPKICDFGFATNQKTDLNEPLGTYHYASLEIFKGKYDGEKVDIFALGIILFNLLTDNYPFSCVAKKEIKSKFKDKIFIHPIYNFIIEKKYSDFWIVQSNNHLFFKEDFKILFQEIIGVDPEKRPSISKILKFPFFDEINKKSSKEIEKLEEEIYNELTDLENLSLSKNSTEKKDNNEIKNNQNKRSISCGEKKYFDIGFMPELFKKEIYLEYYIKIQGKIEPSNYMNSLVNKIKNESQNKIKGYDCEIKFNKNNKNLEFQLVLKEINENQNVEYRILELVKKPEKKEEEQEEEDEDDIKRYEIKKNECTVEITLYESNKEEYILSFMRIAGEKYDFYKNLDYLYYFAKEAL